MYWIYLVTSTQQAVGYNGFITTCFDSHESSSGYVQNRLVLAVLLLTVSCSGFCWSVWSGGWPYTDMNENLKSKTILISLVLPSRFIFYSPIFLHKVLLTCEGASVCMWLYVHKKIFVYTQVLYCEGRHLSYDTFHLPASLKKWQRRSDTIPCQIMSLLSRAKTKR
jgi:hypothetical protein